MPNLFNDEYENLASKGRYGDTMLAHITPEEAALLKARGGAGTINPQTGLPEFYGTWQMNYLAQNPVEREPLPVLAQAFEPDAFKEVAGKLQTITVPQEIRGMGGHTPAYEIIATELAQYADIERGGMGTS